jgi:DHA2 family multidrug resistance protein
MEITIRRPAFRRNSAPVRRPPAPMAVAEPAATPLLRLLIVIAAMIGAVLEVLDTSITNVAIPQMQGNLGATLSQIGWVNTGYIISNVIVLPITGWLADRFGRQRYFAASITAFTLASLMCGVSHTLGSLIFWRIIQGLGGGGLLSTGQVIMLQAFPKSQGGIATAIFGVGVMVGPSLGPVLGGWLTDNYSWPWIFFVNLPFGIAAIVMTLLFVPNVGTGKAGTNRVDFAGVALLAAGLGALQTVLERGQEDDWFQSREILTLSAVAVLGLIGFVWWELRIPYPIVNLRLLKNRSLAAGSLFGLVIGLGLYATTYLLPIFLQDSQGYTAYETGMSLLPSAILSAVSFVIAGSLSQKVDARALLALGVVSFMLGTYGLSHLTAQTGTGDVFWPLMGRGLSLGFLFIPMTVASLGGLKPTEIGEGSGFINLSRQLGGSIGIAAFSTMLIRRQDFHRASLSDHINSGNPTVHTWLQGAQANLVGHGYTATDAVSGALGQLNGLVRQQAAILSFNDAFLMIAVAFLLALPLVFVFQKSATGVDTSTAH